LIAGELGESGSGHEGAEERLEEVSSDRLRLFELVGDGGEGEGEGKLSDDGTEEREEEGVGVEGGGVLSLGEEVLGELGFGDVVLGDLGLEDVGLGDFGLGEADLEESGLGEAGSREAGSGEAGLGDLGLGEVGLGDSGLGDFGLGDVGLGEADFGEVGGDGFSSGGPSTVASAGRPATIRASARLRWLTTRFCSRGPGVPILAGKRAYQSPPTSSWSRYATCCNGMRRSAASNNRFPNHSTRLAKVRPLKVERTSRTSTGDGRG
jgi:hypothetical protein